MSDNKVIDQEIQYPIEDHISSSTYRITEQLFRHYFLYFLHFGCKDTAFLQNMQIKTLFFTNLFGQLKNFYYFCSRKRKWSNEYGRLLRGECNKYVPKSFWDSTS